jgi:dTMP kinase
MRQDGRGARIIAFEGPEGCGKSTQAALTAQWLSTDQKTAELSREPGGTGIGVSLRDVLLDNERKPSIRTEALLMAADRAQHAAEVIGPAIAAGRHVVSDRSVYSTLAYQGYGRSLDLVTLKKISNWALGGDLRLPGDISLWPDIVVLLTVDPSEAQRRRAARGILDRFELEDPEFHDRVADGFRALAAAEPGRFVIVSGGGDPDDVQRRVQSALTDKGVRPLR